MNRTQNSLLVLNCIIKETKTAVKIIEFYNGVNSAQGLGFSEIMEHKGRVGEGDQWEKKGNV